MARLQDCVNYSDVEHESEEELLPAPKDECDEQASMLLPASASANAGSRAFPRRIVAVAGVLVALVACGSLVTYQLHSLDSVAVDKVEQLSENPSGTFAPPAPQPQPVAPLPTQDPTANGVCVGYDCPIGWHLREDLASLHCMEADCSKKDQGTCCLEGLAPSTTTESPCATVPVTPAPTAAPITCTRFTCPTGWQPKPNNGLIMCWDQSGCTAKDAPNCCVEVTTRAPTQPTPTPSPPVVPTSCKVQVPKDGFAPWHVYTIMKATTAKIDTAQKLLIGGQTLNMSGILNIRASKFRCEYVDHEMRAVLDTGDTTPVATINVHNSLYPEMVTTQCLLTQISMYKSRETDVPGLRLDYDDCPFGPAKKATLLIGLRKVPNNWGKTPGLGNFFKDVCPASGTKGGDSTLRFDEIELISGVGCWAQSADYTLMTSEKDCFEPAMVFTLMDAENHLTLFPVTDDEWEYLRLAIPKSAVPANAGGVAPIAPSDSPCDVVPPPSPTPGVHVYGKILQNRMCVAMPELGCHNLCGKVCTPVTPENDPTGFTTTPIPPVCTTCYDCEVPEMFYACCCTILAFMIAHTYHKICSGAVNGISQATTDKIWTDAIQMPDMPYSQLTQPQRAHFRGTCIPAAIGMFCLSFCATLIAFCIVNCLDYVISVHWHQQEMCILLFDIQRFNVRGHWWTEQGSLYTCHNQVCFCRLCGLFVAVWMSLWCLFCYWRYWLEITVEKQEVKRVEAKIEYGGGGGAFAYGGSSVVACTVQ